MQDAKVEKVSSEDSLTVTENEDGTFTVEWAPNDPRWSMFNDIPEEELSKIIIDGLTQACQEILDDE